MRTAPPYIPSGRSFRRKHVHFAANLLSNISCRDMVKKVIKRVTAQYAIIDNNDKFYETATKETLEAFYEESTPESLQQVRLRINPQTFLDVLLMEIRGMTISFASKRKKERLKQEKLLSEEIEALEVKIAAETNNEICMNLIEEQQEK